MNHSLENLNNLEISNVYRPNISRSQLQRYDKQSKKRLEAQAEFICRGKLEDRYIHSAFQTLDGGYIYKDKDDNEIIGFCIWKLITHHDPVHSVQPTRHLYLSLLCSKEPHYDLGATMLNDSEYYAATHRIPYIYLYPATPDLEPYYTKFGFIKGFCVGDKYMCKRVESMQITSRRKTLKKTRSFQKRHAPPANMEGSSIILDG